MTLKEAFTNASQDKNVIKALDAYNTFRNSTSNIFSNDADKVLQESKLPDSIKEKYSNIRETVDDLTGGIATSGLVTSALRHKGIINKGIDLTLKATDKINDGIDNAVYEKEQDSLKDGSSVRNRENEGVMIDEDYDNNVDMSQLDF